MQQRMYPGSLHPHLLPRGCPWWPLTSLPGPWLFSLLPSPPFITFADHDSFLPQNLDITKKKLVHEGPLTWRVTKDKAVEVHVLLLDDLLLLLQRQDERLLLKSHSRTLTPTPDGKTMLRPVLRLTSAMTREVATGELGQVI